VTESEASAKIGRMCDSTVEPTLDSTDLADLVDHAARIDVDGLYRDDAAWTPTWDLNAGAAEGWARKASRAAANFNFAEDGQRFDRAQIYAHCAAQAKMYADKAMGALPHTT
jgi:hypothetical protein